MREGELLEEYRHDLMALRQQSRGSCVNQAAGGASAVMPCPIIHFERILVLLKPVLAGPFQCTFPIGSPTPHVLVPRQLRLAMVVVPLATATLDIVL